jgi:glycerol-3-phosphate acyltransferase PlsY
MTNLALTAVPAIALCVLGAYVCGAIPTGLWISLGCKGIDPRLHGSRNIGATNVGRIIGRKWGFLVLFLDALKGALPTWGLPLLLLGADDPAFVHASVLCGLAAVLGHIFSFWVRFRGGKGVATALGVTAVLIPWGMVAGLATFIVVLKLTRLVSLGSILGSIALAVCQFSLQGREAFSMGQASLTVYSLLVPSLILWSHRQNIRRLLNGTEPRIGDPKPIPDPSDAPHQSEGTSPEAP